MSNGELGNSATGVIENIGDYVAVQLEDLDEDVLLAMARKYVNGKKLGWNVSKPNSWSDYGLHPHVTLGKQFIKNVGQKVQV
jgi:hypothetical protein